MKKNIINNTAFRDLFLGCQIDTEYGQVYTVGHDTLGITLDIADLPAPYPARYRAALALKDADEKEAALREIEDDLDDDANVWTLFEDMANEELWLSGAAVLPV